MKTAACSLILWLGMAAAVAQEQTGNLTDQEKSGRITGESIRLAEAFAAGICDPTLAEWKAFVAKNDEMGYWTGVFTMMRMANAIDAWQCFDAPADKALAIDRLAEGLSHPEPIARSTAAEGLKQLMGHGWADKLATAGKPAAMLTAAYWHLACGGETALHGRIEDTGVRDIIKGECREQVDVLSPNTLAAFRWYFTALREEPWTESTTVFSHGPFSAAMLMSVDYEAASRSLRAQGYTGFTLAKQTALERIQLEQFLADPIHDPDMLLKAKVDAARFQPTPLLP